MSNETTSAILSFAEKHHDFNIEDLSESLCKSMDINRSSLLWHLFKLVNSNVLIRTGRGMYAKVTKPIFSPQPADDIIEVFNLLQSNFPFAKYCIYQGEIISPLQHHLSSNRIIYVETERDSAETIFDFLKGEGRPVFLRPGKDIVYRYVDMDSRTIFVKNLVSEAPLQEVSGIPMPTLEKLMVDILRDSDFFYLQGSESEHIIENAFRMYSVNRSRLFRYSNRRKVKDELLSILNNLNLQ